MNNIIQRSETWYEKRRKMVTASDVAAILGYNPYESKYKVLKKKLENKTNSTIFTNHGIKYEPLAIKEYEKRTKKKVTDVGLIIHNNYRWLGASPDGYIEEDDKLLEIKCVCTRSVKNIPFYYYIQVQIQLEVCDKEMCDFFQCKFENNILVNSSLNTIFRNKVWFNKIIDKLKIFHNDLMYLTTRFNSISIKCYMKI